MIRDGAKELEHLLRAVLINDKDKFEESTGREKQKKGASHPSLVQGALQMVVSGTYRWEGICKYFEHEGDAG